MPSTANFGEMDARKGTLAFGILGPHARHSKKRWFNHFPWNETLICQGDMLTLGIFLTRVLLEGLKHLKMEGFELEMEENG